MSLNEFGIIEKYFAGLTPGGRGVICGIGDDAAVLSPDTDCHLVVATDSLVSGIHFFPDAGPSDIGYKALAVNLSDMAAMAATPRWVTLALTLSESELTDSWLSGFSRGLSELADDYVVSLVGGDLCKGPLAVTIQVIGECPKGREINRSGAKAGDAIYLSGELGSAACALAMFKSGKKNIPRNLSERLHRPLPRVELGLSLRGIAGAMIDISDGLLADLGHLVKSSRVGALINMDTIPVDGYLDDHCEPAEKWRYILSGGDDYELCFTVPEEKRQELENSSRPVYHIGEITTEQGIRCTRDDGSIHTPDDTGYSHF